MTLHPIEYKEGIIYVDRNNLSFKDLKQGEYCYDLQTSRVERYIPSSRGDGVQWKIYGQSHSLSLSNIPYVETEEDIDDTNGMLDALETIHTGYRNNDFKSGFEQGWKERGYKAASAKKYTEQDLRKAIQLSKLSYSEIKDKEKYYRNQYTENEIVQSFQPKIKSIEIELDTWNGEPVNWAPVTYQKDGKIYLKIKKMNYEIENSKV